MKFCPKCGKELSPGDVKCGECGTDLRARIDDVYAGMFIRLISLLIDIGPLFVLGEIILWLIRHSYLQWNPLIRLTFAGTLYFLMFFLYFWLLEERFNGKTLGKFLLKLRTVDEQTLETPTRNQYIINNLTRGTILFFIDIMIGLLKNPEDPKKRLRYTQEFSKTVVIKI